LRAIIGALVGLVAFAGVALALSPNAPLATFPTEAQAQQHCPRDTVVWLNLPTSVYHYKGQRWYGTTVPGAFVCRSEADQAAIKPPDNNHADFFAASLGPERMPDENQLYDDPLRIPQTRTAQ
jgi:hypothetical protein